MLFRNRAEAGKMLAQELARYRDEAPIVLGLPRGGVPVAYHVAQELRAPLDVWVVRKLGAPDQPELGLGAISEGGEVFVDPNMVELTGATIEELRRIAFAEAQEIERRVRCFRGARARPIVRDKTVIVVDDGIATGGTVRAALRAIRKAGARRLVLGVPVAASDTLAALAEEADEIVCLYAPKSFGAIGYHYLDFAQVPDEEVTSLLQRARRERGEPEPAAAVRDGAGPMESEVVVSAGATALQGTLSLPADPIGLVLFAHGSGSSRHSPRNRLVAGALQRERIGTLLFDLLTPEQERRDRRTQSLRFDIDLLAARLVGATDWARAQKAITALPIGYFGASTGAAAALVAAARRPDVVRAVVSRGGRPDLASGSLPRVEAPTLLIVGSLDAGVLALNERAHHALRCTKQLAIVRGATHLFEEPGALEQVARLAAGWFTAQFEVAGLRATG
jgi:putative phosphoribosyl transferase